MVNNYGWQINNKYTHKYRFTNYAVLLQCTGVSLTRFIHSSEEGCVTGASFRASKVMLCHTLALVRSIHFLYRLFNARVHNYSQYFKFRMFFILSRKYIQTGRLQLTAPKHPVLTAQNYCAVPNSFNMHKTNMTADNNGTS